MAGGDHNWVRGGRRFGMADYTCLKCGAVRYTANQLAYQQLVVIKIKLTINNLSPLKLKKVAYYESRYSGNFNTNIHNTYTNRQHHMVMVGCAVTAILCALIWAAAVLVVAVKLAKKRSLRK